MKTGGILRTVLNERHYKLHAKMVEFCGWEMPIQYSLGSMKEHMTVREDVGMFDVSHMGRVIVEGEDAEAFLDYLSTNNMTAKKDLSASYTVWCREDGTAIDDVMVYRYSKQYFFVIVNARNRLKDLEHMNLYAKDFDVKITDCYETDGIIAVQGPRAKEILQDLFPGIDEIKFMRFIKTQYKSQNMILSRTGYTGGLGYEIYAPHEVIIQIWDKLLARGVQAIGLAARDTLRLEAGFALYGHELTDSIAASESVSNWTVKLAKENFLGKKSLQSLKESPKKRSQYAILLKEKGVPRREYELLKNDRVIGSITSGTFSPCIQKGIAIVMTSEKLELGDEVEIQIRKKRFKAEVTKLPFVNLKALNI